MWLREQHKAAIIKGTLGGTVSKGDLLVLSTNTFVRTGDAPSATIMGIAMEDGVTSDVILIQLVTSEPILSAKYYGTSKTSLTDADISKTFDFYDYNAIDLDDTTGGVAMCVDYDNDIDVMHFILIPSGKVAY
jgi:hypothetical protein